MASETDLYIKAKNGDEAAYYSWFNEIQPDMGRFAYQLGISLEKLPEFQKASLQQLYKQLVHFTPDQAEMQLFTIMAQMALQPGYQFKNGKNQVLGFQEDQELHTLLQKLELDQRISLALLYFHNKSINEISTITSKSAQQVMQAEAEGLQALQQILQIEGDPLLKRLTLLQKSYQRFIPPPPMEQENRKTAATIPIESAHISAAPAQSYQKKTAIVLVAAGLFLAAVIGVSFSVNDQQAKTAGTTEFQQAEKVTDDMVANWRSQYEAIKETSPKRLGMSLDQYDQLDYVKQADAEMIKVFSDESVRSMKDNPIMMEQTVDRLFRQIETPQGMVDSLAGDNPMLDAETENFLLDYAAKTSELQVFADSVLYRYREELESTVVLDQLSPEKLMAQSGSLPEELRLVVEALPEYNLFPAVHPNKDQFRTLRDVTRLNQQQPIISDPYAPHYLSLLASEPYFDDSGFLLPIENVPQQLISMEQALLEEGESKRLFDGIEVAYQQIFWQLLKGSEGSSIFDEQGKVKEEYRKAWNDTASSNPMAFLMLPILNEMEASNWTDSDHHDQLEFHDLLNALAMEKSGELAEKLPNGNLVIEEALVDMKDFDYSRIKPLYESFKVSYDLQVLAGEPPLDVLFLYHYANKLEDTETLWHLSADSPLKPTLEEFNEQWQKIPDLAEKARWVELSKDSFTQRVKDKVYIYPHVEMDEFDERLDFLLVTERDQIWQIDYQQYEQYDLADEADQYIQIVDFLYTEISSNAKAQLPADTKPGEVAGVFFKAIEKKDIPTIKKIVVDAGWKDEEYAAFFELHSFRPFSELEQLSFRTNFSTDFTNGISGMADIKYKSGSQEGIFQELFYMKKTPDGWRMTDLNMY